MIKSDSIILFQGDSVTDAGRTYDAYQELGRIFSPTDVNLELGYGYPLVVYQYFQKYLLPKKAKIFNRAISGNRTIDLKNRWEKDTITLRPTHLSILIGINDTWRRYDSNDATSTATFEANYRYLLEDAYKKLKCEFILMEPFLLPSDKEKFFWFEDLSPKQAVVKRLAKEFNAIHIPLQRVFDKKCLKIKAQDLSTDGVHPTALGHQIIAESFIDKLIR